MALTTFYGWTAAELLTAMAAAQEDLAKGRSIIQSGSGDVNVAMQLQLNAKERIFELQMALYEVDPETYEAFACVGHSQTRATFSSSSSSTEVES
jgi:hypothetical protein